jgi:hypothetical protein
MSEYTVYYHGKVTVDAENISDAQQQAYDLLKDANVGEFSTDEIQEDFI